MRNKTALALAAAATLSAGVLSNSVLADGIGVNFIGDNNGGGASVTGTAGVVPQANWNNVAGPTQNNGTGVALVSATGAALTSTIGWSSPNLWASGVGLNQDGILMQGYLDNSPGQDSIATITGLPASIAGNGTTPYSVIVYLAGDTAGDNRGGTYTVNGIVQTALEIGPSTGGIYVPASAVTPGNFIVFTGITGSNLTIDVHPTSGGTPRAPFDGFQVISGTVPEPASLGLLGLGSIAFLARRRRA
jgi:PEP-CTERM motif